MNLLGLIYRGVGPALKSRPVKGLRIGMTERGADLKTPRALELEPAVVNQLASDLSAKLKASKEAATRRAFEPVVHKDTDLWGKLDLEGRMHVMKKINKEAGIQFMSGDASQLGLTKAYADDLRHLRGEAVPSRTKRFGTHALLSMTLSSWASSMFCSIDWPGIPGRVRFESMKCEDVLGAAKCLEDLRVGQPPIVLDLKLGTITSEAWRAILDMSARITFSSSHEVPVLFMFSGLSDSEMEFLENRPDVTGPGVRQDGSALIESPTLEGAVSPDGLGEPHLRDTVTLDQALTNLFSGNEFHGVQEKMKALAAWRSELLAKHGLRGLYTTEVADYITGYCLRSKIPHWQARETLRFQYGIDDPTGVLLRSHERGGTLNETERHLLSIKSGVPWRSVVSAVKRIDVDDPSEVEHGKCFEWVFSAYVHFGPRVEGRMTETLRRATGVTALYDPYYRVCSTQDLLANTRVGSASIFKDPEHRLEGDKAVLRGYAMTKTDLQWYARADHGEIVHNLVQCKFSDHRDNAKGKVDMRLVFEYMTFLFRKTGRRSVLTVAAPRHDPSATLHRVNEDLEALRAEKDSTFFVPDAINQKLSPTSDPSQCPFAMVYLDASSPVWDGMRHVVELLPKIGNHRTPDEHPTILREIYRHLYHDLELRRAGLVWVENPPFRTAAEEFDMIVSAQFGPNFYLVSEFLKRHGITGLSLLDPSACDFILATLLRPMGLGTRYEHFKVSHEIRELLSATVTVDLDLHGVVDLCRNWGVSEDDAKILAKFLADRGFRSLSTISSQPIDLQELPTSLRWNLAGVFAWSRRPRRPREIVQGDAVD